MSFEISDIHMQSFQNAVARAISIAGPNILEDQTLFLNVIEDLVPYHESDYKFLKKTLDTDLGSMLKDACKSDSQEEQYYNEILNYLLEVIGLNEKKAIQFMGYFPFLKGKTNNGTYLEQDSRDEHNVGTLNDISENLGSSDIIVKKIEDNIENGSVETAVKIFEESEQSLSSSEVYSYICLRLGGALEVSNPKKAISYLNKSAAKGNSGAMFQLGIMYENGRYVDQNYEKALEWYHMARENGEYAADLVYSIVEEKLKKLKKVTGNKHVLFRVLNKDTAKKDICFNVGAEIRGRSFSEYLSIDVIFKLLYNDNTKQVGIKNMSTFDWTIVKSNNVKQVCQPNKVVPIEQGDMIRIIYKVVHLNVIKIVCD